MPKVGYSALNYYSWQAVAVAVRQAVIISRNSFKEKPQLLLDNNCSSGSWNSV